MKPSSADQEAINLLSPKEFLRVIHSYLRGSQGGSQVWDVLTTLRGPDSPSERDDMTPEEASRAYDQRRKRKYKTVEVIRAAAVPGVGGARYHHDDKVTLPPKREWDHFDKHVARAAAALGLKVVEEKS